MSKKQESNTFGFIVLLLFIAFIGVITYFSFATYESECNKDPEYCHLSGKHKDCAKLCGIDNYFYSSGFFGADECTCGDKE